MSAEDGKHIGTSDHHYHPHPLPHNGMSQGDADSQQPVMGFPPPLSPNNNASAPPDPYLPAHPAPVYPPQHPTVYPPGQPAPYPPTVINEINIGNPGVGYVYAEGRPVLVQAKPGLPCCGMGVGWFL
ncbi:hypothetical protein K2173_004627 [Erythroxylum novogranatense]|uniref:Uncharacterized protein n=1 Tax=Erythroxylum novogranatense TaxID=1862640 RepID=A0AAV8UC04_9ROSI|nr:hypothetical protein K2173_004627 [Erythroxylum novogranatense]